MWQLAFAYISIQGLVIDSDADALDMYLFWTFLLMCGFNKKNIQPLRYIWTWVLLI